MSSDEELVAAWRTGSKQAADALTQRYYWRVFRFFELKLQWQAEDLTQKTFMSCVERLEFIEGSFATYLFGVARRQLQRALRDSYSEANRRRRFGSGATPSHQTRLSMLAAERQEQQLLLRAIATLPVESQMTLALYYWESMNATELATVFEVSASAMRSRLVKARADLREAVEKAAASAQTRASLQVDIEGWARSLAETRIPAAPEATW